eukprot:TRINITY_DN2271_c0_g1_i1.p1 TRINITY_DN2271_c0_g1~~TRINITY_DN2271_c0_g1_i1.p1  ORF type:complete len:352 (+),score=86.04 TRINITY_DN2271_c0_g1_i1:150-1205(+)
MSGANPFDSADDVNPFGKVEEYNPFAGPGAQGAPTSPSPPPRSTSPAPASLQFQDTRYDDFAAPVSGQVGQPPVSNKIPTGPADLQDIKIDDAYNDNAFASGALPSDSGQVKLEPMQEELSGDDYGFWQLAFYQKMFNVDTVDVLDRIFRACVPFRRNFFPVVKPNPDLYGLLWICATLVFIMAAAGNFANFLNAKWNGTLWAYDFSKLPYAAGVIYGYNLLIPAGLWGILSWIDDFDISLIQMLCLYGYSMFIFIPSCVLSALPWDISRYLSVGIACGISVLHLLFAMWPQLGGRSKWSLFLLIGVAALHAALALSFIFFFFDIKQTVVYGPVAAPTPVGVPVVVDAPPA